MTLESREKRQEQKYSIQQKIKNIMLNEKLWLDCMENDIPRKNWEKHGDALMLSDRWFTHPHWYQSKYFWQTLAKMFGVSRIFQKSKILPDNFRSPSKIEILYSSLDVYNPDLMWVKRKENGIVYTWNITKCMFSCGNISEKLRIAAMPCSGQTVIDMFAGIGYFTLPYVVHAGAKHVHACEWNSEAVEALRKNINLNLKNISDRQRITIYEGDNRTLCPVGVADRVNLGILPSADGWFQTAVKALRRDTGGILHIHGNVDRGRRPCLVSSLQDKEFACENIAWREWCLETGRKLVNCLNDQSLQGYVKLIKVNKVKSYGPNVDHLVLDVKIDVRLNL